VDEDRQSRSGGAGHHLSRRLRAHFARTRLRREEPRLPRRLRRRLEDDAEAWIRAECGRVDPHAFAADRGRSPRGALTGWYAAAASLVIALAGWWPRLEPIASGVTERVAALASIDARVARARLDGREAHLGRWGWVHESGLTPGVEGEVVWDGERQQGHFTLAGLPPNAHAGGQYQLWIFDAVRDDRYPVDGGVFDVPDGAAEITVPIRPALYVHRPAAFAITLEPVGGVVVSDRAHLMAMARTTSR
jgi:hypothetical protein